MYAALAETKKNAKDLLVPAIKEIVGTDLEHRVAIEVTSIIRYPGRDKEGKHTDDWGHIAIQTNMSQEIREKIWDKSGHNHSRIFFQSPSWDVRAKYEERNTQEWQAAPNTLKGEENTVEGIIEELYKQITKTG